MVRLLSLFLAIFVAAPAFAAFQTTSPYIMACGNAVQIPPSCNGSVSNVIYLGGYATASAHYATLRKPNSSSGYQTTSGKTLHIFAACVTSQSTTQMQFGLCYGTSDIGMDSASAPSGVSNNFGTASFNFIASPNSVPATVVQTDFQTPASDYTCAEDLQGTGNMYISAWGCEQ